MLLLSDGIFIGHLEHTHPHLTQSHLFFFWYKDKPTQTSLKKWRGAMSLNDSRTGKFRRSDGAHCCRISLWPWKGCKDFHKIIIKSIWRKDYCIRVCLCKVKSNFWDEVCSGTMLLFQAWGKCLYLLSHHNGPRWPFENNDGIWWKYG